MQTALMKSTGTGPASFGRGEPSAYVRRALVTTHTSWRRRPRTDRAATEPAPDRADPAADRRRRTRSSAGRCARFRRACAPPSSSGTTRTSPSSRPPSSWAARRAPSTPRPRAAWPASATCWPTARRWPRSGRSGGDGGDLNSATGCTVWLSVLRLRSRTAMSSSGPSRPVWRTNCGGGGPSRRWLRRSAPSSSPCRSAGPTASRARPHRRPRQHRSTRFRPGAASASTRPWSTGCVDCRGPACR